MIEIEEVELPSTSPVRREAGAIADQIDGMLEKYIPQRSDLITPLGQKNYYEWYYAYGKVLKPKSILEIGVRGGGSVVATCLGSGRVDHVALIDDQTDGVALMDAAHRVSRVVAGTVVKLVEDSQRLGEIPKELLPPSKKFDVISIDGDHRVGPCYHDLRITLPYLAPDGHILVDDGHWSWVVEAVRSFHIDHPELCQLVVPTFTTTRILHFEGRAEDHLRYCPLLERP